jgi:hypothetical protein
LDGRRFPVVRAHPDLRVHRREQLRQDRQPRDRRQNQTLQELDPTKARTLANEFDNLIWAEGFSPPLIQSPGNAAVNSSLANFGAAGLADLDYTAIAFMR